MPLDVSKFVEKKKKRNCFHTTKYLWILYWRTLLNFWRKYRKIIKDLLKCLFKVPLVLLGFIIVVCLCFITNSYLQNNFFYSIPMPKIYGLFLPSKDHIWVRGIENIKNENSVSLVLVDLNCDLKAKYCREEKVSIFNIGGVEMNPYISNYDIVYKDKYKVIFDDGIVRGDIDLIEENVKYTYKKSGRRTEIITKQPELLKTEKRIIKKYLRQGIKWW